MEKIERHLRVEEFAHLCGYSIATIRKKIARREIGYRKCGRIIAIPESEVARILGNYRAPVSAGQKSR
jgi:predicted DNA-binding transcriptional regulator AlpA